MKRTNRSVTLLSSALLLAACGGSGSGSGAPDTGGSGALAVTRGAITSTSAGAVTVNGVQLTTSGATIRVEDRAGAAAELHHGMIVTVKGHFDDRTGTATEIEFEHAVSGLVTGKSGGELLVGGETVRVDDTTEFGEDDALRLGGVNVGDRVGVSGVPDERGGLRASRLDHLSGTAEDLELRGFVSNLSASGFTLKLSPDAAESWTVTLAPGATLPPGLADGAYVEVRSLGLPEGRVILAATISLEDRFGGGEGEVEVEGIVTSGDSSAFVIDGVTVRPTASAEWRFGVPADLVPGVKVEAEGRLDASGVLVAHEVSFRAVVRIVAPVADLVVAGSSATMTLLGIPVSVSDLTDWRMSAALVNGGVVEVRGYPSRTGDRVIATRLEDDGTDRVFLQAVVSSEDAAAGRLGLLGMDVVTDGGTEYRDGRQGSSTEIPMARGAFFDAVEAGRTVVKARGRDVGAWSGTTLTAEELELEHDE